MSVSEAARLMRELHTAPESREMHDTLVALAAAWLEKRTTRRKQAEAEEHDAILCHVNAIEARLAFIAAHPEPQQAIFP